MLVMKPENENEESRGTEGARRATGVAREAAGRNGDNPDPEVTNKAIRRRFSAAYKRRVVREVDRCTKPGEWGGLTTPGGIVFLEPAHLAAATRCRGIGRDGFGEARTESAAEGRPGQAHR